MTFLNKNNIEKMTYMERLADLLDSRTVIVCHNTFNPSMTLAQSRDDDTFKLYLSDIGLFTTMIFKASPKSSKTNPKNEGR